VSVVLFLIDGDVVEADMTLEVAEAAWINLSEVAGHPVAEIALISSGIKAEDIMDGDEWEGYKALQHDLFEPCPTCGASDWCPCDPA
jgi:hypothetical protein